MAELQRQEICARIKEARKLAGLKQPELAALLDVQMRTYQNYEGDRVPWGQLGRIADVTGTNLRWLLHGEDEPQAIPAEVMVAIRAQEKRAADLEKKVDAMLALLTAGETPETIAEPPAGTVRRTRSKQPATGRTGSESPKKATGS